MSSITELPVRAVGWRVLVEPIEIKDKTDGGILLAPEAVKAQQYLRYIGKVVDMGNLCFHDDKFKPHPKAATEPWCKIGQYVAFGRHAGQEIVATRDGELHRYRLINDDDVLAVIADPSAFVFDV